MRAVIEASALHAVKREAMYHSGVPVGDKKLARGPIEGQTAERRPGIHLAIQRDVGKQRHSARDTVDFPDRSRPAIGDYRAEQAGHEGGVRGAAPGAVGHAIAVGIGYDDRQAVGGCGGGVDVRRARIVEREREHLADLPGRHRERLRRCNQLRSRRSAQAVKQDHAQRGAVKINVDFVDALRRRTQHIGAGKSSDRRITGWQNNLRPLRKRRRRLKQKK
ncbi:MAG TPA: hypothetical protein VMJ52_19215 [Xanthobacteraceae bacterium]|nr:hypothetical protein [Xanthobacteraceae bacterium]